MSKVAAAMLKMASTAPAAQWHLSGGNQEELILIRKSSVRRIGNTVTFWQWMLWGGKDAIGEQV